MSEAKSLYERLGGVYSIATQQYSGKSMSDSHSPLQITPSEWVAFMGDLDDSLAKFQVPTPEQAEVVAIVESTRQDIVIEA
jgi:hemoglobin